MLLKTMLEVIAKHEATFMRLDVSMGTDKCAGLPDHVVLEARGLMAKLFKAVVLQTALQGDVVEKALGMMGDPEREVGK